MGMVFGLGRFIRLQHSYSKILAWKMIAGRKMEIVFAKVLKFRFFNYVIDFEDL